MKRRTGRLALGREVVRQLRPIELRAVAGGQLATSEAIDGWPCPGEYSWRCAP